MGRDTVNRPTDVYRCYDADWRLLYVGISVNGYGRLEVHAREASWWRQVRHVGLEQYRSRPVAQWVEACAIRDEQPLHNVTRNIAWWRPTPEQIDAGIAQPLEVDEWDEAA